MQKTDVRSGEDGVLAGLKIDAILSGVEYLRFEVSRRRRSMNVSMSTFQSAVFVRTQCPRSRNEARVSRAASMSPAAHRRARRYGRPRDEAWWPRHTGRSGPASIHYIAAAMTVVVIGARTRVPRIRARPWAAAACRRRDLDDSQTSRKPRGVVAHGRAGDLMLTLPTPSVRSWKTDYQNSKKQRRAGGKLRLASRQPPRLAP